MKHILAISLLVFSAQVFAGEGSETIECQEAGGNLSFIIRANGAGDVSLSIDAEHIGQPPLTYYNEEAILMMQEEYPVSSSAFAAHLVNRLNYSLSAENQLVFRAGTLLSMNAQIVKNDSFSASATLADGPVEISCTHSESN